MKEKDNWELDREGEVVIDVVDQMDSYGSLKVDHDEFTNLIYRFLGTDYTPNKVRVRAKKGVILITREF